MNKNLKKFIVIALSLTLALSMIACSDDTSEEEGKYDAGTYEASAKGYNEDVNVKVEVTFDANEITSVEVVEHEETEGIGTNAIDQLPQEIVDGQTLALDAVSGATMTSNAIIEAVSDAVGQAGGDAESLK